MADVPDFEDLLAVFEDDASKQPLQHSGLLLHHQDLHQSHQTQAPLLQDVINCPSIPATNMHVDGSVMANQNAFAITEDMSRTGHLLSGTGDTSDAMTLQGGSSLGSLFLNSVDEILLSEKTTGSIPSFALANAHNVSPKPNHPTRSKNPPQCKTDKSAQPYVAALEPAPAEIKSRGNISAQQTQNNSVGYVQEQAGLSTFRTTKSSFNHPTRVLAAGGSQASKETYLASSSESFAKPNHRQQTMQIGRPRSNAPGDNHGYGGSVPQPSPCGSADSGFAPRTPHSNNPLTPQSVHQSPTPLSGQSSHSNRSTSATPLDQIQHSSNILHDSSFVQLSLGATNSPPPIIPDDQSHLQYLNTTPSQKSVQSEILGTVGALDDFPAFKNMFPDQDFQHDLSNSAYSHVPQSGWIQPHFTQENVTYSLGEPFSSSDRGHSKLHNIIGPSLPGTSRQVFSTSQSSFSESTSTLTTSNKTLDEGLPVPSQPYDRNAGYGASSDGLTYVQSQLLDNLTRTKSKTSEATTKTPYSQDVFFQKENIDHSALFKTSEASNSGINSSQVNSNTMLNMLNTAECGIKQIFSSYEDVSPVSDYSPNNKEPLDTLKMTDKTSTDLLPMSTFTEQNPKHSAYVPDMVKTQSDLQNKNKYREYTTSTNLTKAISVKEKSEFMKEKSEFVFDDEFGFNHNEPTIRLQGQKSDANSKVQEKQYPTAGLSKSMLTQTMQRENYTDQSVYDSVKELAALQQKNKSLMEALSARSTKPPPKGRMVSKPGNTTGSFPTSSMQVGLNTHSPPTQTVKPTRSSKKTTKTSVPAKVYKRDQKEILNSKTFLQQNVIPAITASSPEDSHSMYSQYLNKSNSGTVSSTMPSQMPSQKVSTLIQQHKSDKGNDAVLEDQQTAYSHYVHNKKQTASSALPVEKLQQTGFLLQKNSVTEGNISFQRLDKTAGDNVVQKQHFAQFTANQLPEHQSKVDVQSSENFHSLHTQKHIGKTKQTDESHNDYFHLQFLTEPQGLNKTTFPATMSSTEKFTSTLPTCVAYSNQSQNSPTSMYSSSRNMFEINQMKGLHNESQISFPSNKTNRTSVSERNKQLHNEASLSVTAGTSALSLQRQSLASTISQGPNVNLLNDYTMVSSREPPVPHYRHSDIIKSHMVKLMSNGEQANGLSASVVITTKHSDVFTSTPAANTRIDSFDKYPMLPDMSHIHLKYKPTDPGNAAASVVLPTMPKSFHVGTTSSVVSHTTLPNVWPNRSEMYSTQLKNRSSDAAMSLTETCAPSNAVEHNISSKLNITTKPYTISHLPDSVAAGFMNKHSNAATAYNLPSRQDQIFDTGSLMTQNIIQVPNQYSRSLTQKPPDQEEVSQSLEILRLAQKRLGRQPSDQSFMQSVEQLLPNVATPQMSFSMSQSGAEPVANIKHTNFASLDANLPYVTTAKGVVQQDTNTVTMLRKPLSSSLVSEQHKIGDSPLSLISSKKEKHSLPLENPISVTVPSTLSNTSSITASANSLVTSSSITVPSLPSIGYSKIVSENKAEQLAPPSGSISILKDKTYHGPKKKHILEKYSQQNQVALPGQNVSQPGLVPKASSEDPKNSRSKRRKLSIDKNSNTRSKSNFSTAISSEKSVLDLSSPLGKNHAPDNNDIKNLMHSPISKTTRSFLIGESTTVMKADCKAQDEEQSERIFTLFDSLLQEASQSAANSLKNEPNKKGEKEKTEKSSSQEISSIVKVSAGSTDKVITSKESSINSSPANVLSAVQHSKTTTVTPSVPVLNEISTLAVNRAPINFPFKWRRHLHNRTSANTTEGVQASATNISVFDTVISSKTTLHTPAVSSPNISNVSTTGISNVSTVNALGSGVISHPSAVSSSLLTCKPKPPGIKLRITAFRSSSGQVIHQSTLLGDVLSDEVESDDTEYEHEKMKKHKKRKKHQKHVTPSDSFTAIPICNPPEKLLLKKQSLEKVSPSNNHNDDKCLSIPQIEDKISSLVSGDSDVSSNKSKPTRKRKRRSVKSTMQPSEKLIRLNTSLADSDTEVRKQPLKYNNSSKKAVSVTKAGPRYKPKSVNSQVVSQSSDNSLSVSVRAPRKPPMYLTAGTQQSVSVPTIQLVSRANVKTNPKSSGVVSIMHSVKSSSGKLVSVKLHQTKTVQAQILPKTAHGGRRYLLQTSTPANIVVSQKIIVPKLVSPTFSVGKAAVYAVSSANTNVSVTPTIQIITSPVKSLSTDSSIASSAQPVVMKQIPVSWISKVTNSSCAVVNSASNTSTKVSMSSSFKNTTCVVTSVKSPDVLSTPQVIVDNTSPVSARKQTKKCYNATSLPATSTGITVIADPELSRCCKNSVDTHFQAAFSKLISGPNPLGKYTPPPVPVHLKRLTELNDETHPCYECGDAFIFHSNLKEHYCRKSIVVKVRCVQCNQMLAFFNKCEILRHARKHSTHGDVMQFNGAQLTPIALSLCKPRTKEYFLKLADEANESVEDQDMDVTGCTKACTECQFLTDAQTSLEDHFQRKVPEWKTCDICRLPLHNQCVFSAHMRMHRHSSPHTCPECGQSFEESNMDFNLHLRIHCFHLSRTLCFKCKLCNLIFPTDDQLRHHLRLNHVQVTYKCRECWMSFKTTQEIANHQRTDHKFVPEPTNNLKVMHTCPLCDSIFTDSSHSQQLFMLHKHFDSHINAITAYKCYLCKSVFEKKSKLRDHLRKEHEISSLTEIADTVTVCPPVYDTEQEPQQQGNLTSQENKRKRLMESKRIVGSKKMKKTINSEVFTSTRLEQSNTENESRSETEIENSLHSPKRLRQPIRMRIKGMKAGCTLEVSAGESPEKQKTERKLSPTKIMQGRKVYPCTECDKVFFSSHSRSSHVRSFHRGIRTLYCCTHCTVKFAKRITVVRHLQRFHGINPDQKEKIKTIRTHSYTSREEADPTAVAHGEIKPSATKVNPEKRLPRKKVTTRGPPNARARRLAAAARNKMMEDSFQNSDESYGEVDEKTVEDGWNVHEEPEAKQESCDADDVDESFFSFPDMFTCIKCDFQHPNRIVFQDHIIEHSRQTLDSGGENSSAALTMVQCTECGLCFASTTSLDKHLRVKHQIKHRLLLERYDAKLRAECGNLLFNSNGFPMVAGGSSTVGSVYRCKVCFHKFDQESELKTHMRTHGLAFVKSKQH